MGRPSLSRPVPDRSPCRHPRQRHVHARFVATRTSEVDPSGRCASLATVAHAITVTWRAMPSHHASALTDPPYGVKAERTAGLPPVSIKPPLGGTGKGLLSSTTISTSQRRSRGTDLNVRGVTSGTLIPMRPFRNKQSAHHTAKTTDDVEEYNNMVSNKGIKDFKYELLLASIIKAPAPLRSRKIVNREPNRLNHRRGHIENHTRLDLIIGIRD
ncbi:hypothetical protein B296_00037881 [Ensete ventricosum]|uniref:Uncharacterized protein n=1 Tax=Ensete ventricosum TaxID=4639 RepID=A0A426YGF1_ENSVE|nr:hypothetical protein B296_00037881 [Ensete ventricosum]